MAILGSLSGKRGGKRKGDGGREGERMSWKVSPNAFPNVSLMFLLMSWNVFHNAGVKSLSADCLS